MRFELTIDIDTITGDHSDEIARALRYWAGNLKHYEIDVGTTEAIYDSAYSPIGEWKIS